MKFVMSGKRVNYLHVLIGIIIIYLSESSSGDAPQVPPSTPLPVTVHNPGGNDDNTTAQITRIAISPTQNPHVDPPVGNSSSSTDPSRGKHVPEIHSAAFDAARSYPKNLSLETAPSKALVLEDFTFRETAGFVAIGFLLFSMFGYIGFVSWRRYLQNKYGNGQTLITEEVYDVSDLRNFEI